MARSEMRNSAPKELITPHQFDVLHRIRKRELPPDPFILSNLEFTPDHPFFRNVCVGARVLATPEPSSLQYQMAGYIPYSERAIAQMGGITATPHLIRITDIMKSQGVAVCYLESAPREQRHIRVMMGNVPATINFGWQDIRYIPTEGQAVARTVNTPIHIIFGDDLRAGILTAKNREEIATQFKAAQAILNALMIGYKREYEILHATGPVSLQIPDFTDKTNHYMMGYTNLFLDIPSATSNQAAPVAAPETPPTSDNSAAKKEVKEATDATTLYHLFTAEERMQFSTFDEVQGQPEAVEAMTELSLGFKYPQSLKRRGTTLPKGALLYGPPGTGKTMLACALAREADCEVMHVNASEIISKWVGDAEKNMNTIFDEAERIHRKTGKITLLILDEFDSLIPDRGAEETNGVGKKVISAFLQRMDGVQNSEGIFVIGTSNRKNAIDEAVLRSGRMELKIEMKQPDAQGRLEILAVHLRRVIKQVAENEGGAVPSDFIDPSIMGGVTLEESEALIQLAQKMEGASGADINAVVRTALRRKVTSEMNFIDSFGSVGELWSPLSTDDLFVAWEILKNKNTDKKARPQLAFSNL